jgi:uncharacterized protein DUF4833
MWEALRRPGAALGAILAILALAPPGLGQSADSVGDACPAHLFVIERSKNANIVVYDANRGPAGDIASSESVVAYWLLNGEKDRREELNLMEREHAYGFDVTPGGASGTYTMAFKADQKRRLTIHVVGGCPVASTRIGGHDGTLRRIFVRSKEGSLRPRVEFIELFGEDASGGGPLYEKFVPGK